MYIILKTKAVKSPTFKINPGEVVSLEARHQTHTSLGARWASHAPPITIFYLLFHEPKYIYFYNFDDPTHNFWLKPFFWRVFRGSLFGLNPILLRKVWENDFWGFTRMGAKSTEKIQLAQIIPCWNRFGILKKLTPQNFFGPTSQRK